MPQRPIHWFRALALVTAAAMLSAALAPNTCRRAAELAEAGDAAVATSSHVQVSLNPGVELSPGAGSGSQGAPQAAATCTAVLPGASPDETAGDSAGGLPDPHPCGSLESPPPSPGPPRTS